MFFNVIMKLSVWKVNYGICLEMHVFVLSFILVFVSSLEHAQYDIIPEGIVVANIKKRETLPLQSGKRRLLDNKNLNYRRTKDIRETSVDRHFEITEALLREAQREGQLSSSQGDDMKEDEFKTTQRQDDEMRPEMNGVRDDIREEVREETGDRVRDDIRNEGREEEKMEAGDETKVEPEDNREEDPFKNDDVMESDFLTDDNKRPEINGDNKDRRHKVQREFSWLTIENNDGNPLDN